MYLGIIVIVFQLKAFDLTQYVFQKTLIHHNSCLFMLDMLKILKKFYFFLVDIGIVSLRLRSVNRILQLMHMVSCYNG